MSRVRGPGFSLPRGPWCERSLGLPRCEDCACTTMAYNPFVHRKAPGMPTSRRPVDAYKAIVDQLVHETTRSVTQRVVTERGYFLETSDHDVYNPLVRSLTPEQRRLLGDMLLQERGDAIHDVLAVLTHWMSSDGLAFTFQGEPMLVDVSGMGLHGDFVGRLQGWEWPNNGDPTKP